MDSHVRSVSLCFGEDQQGQEGPLDSGVRWVNATSAGGITSSTVDISEALLGRWAFLVSTRDIEY